MILYTIWHFSPILQIGTLRLEITQLISIGSIKLEDTYSPEAFSEHIRELSQHLDMNKRECVYHFTLPAMSAQELVIIPIVNGLAISY